MSNQLEMFTPVNESKHDELLELLNPLIEFMDKNDFHYFIVAGKGGMCSRYMRGKYQEVHGMVHGMMENNAHVRYLIKDLNDEIPS
jgi:hypothetical protein